MNSNITYALFTPANLSADNSFFLMPIYRLTFLWRQNMSANMNIEQTAKVNADLSVRHVNQQIGHYEGTLCSTSRMSTK